MSKPTIKELNTRMHVTASAIEMFDKAVKEFVSDPHLPPEIAMAQLAGMQSQLEDLKDQHSALKTEVLELAKDLLIEVAEGIDHGHLKGFTVGHRSRIRLFLGLPDTPHPHAV